MARSKDKAPPRPAAAGEVGPVAPRAAGPGTPGLYGPEDLAGFDAARDLGQPGEFPFTRGPYATMYRGRPWTMRQYAGYGDAEESNRRYRYLLEQGAAGLSIAFDLPTQMGMDGDHPLARGEVGRVGVAISHLGDMRRLLAGIPLDRVSIAMTINATAPILLALLAALARERGEDPRRLAGTTQNDILKEYIARGTYIYPPAPALRFAADLIAHAAREMPEWNPISVSGYHLREAGCSAAQEIAFTLANGLVYARATMDRGLEADEFAPRFSFFFNAHNDLLTEAAKFRAARRLWARLVRERLGTKNPLSERLRFHAQTAGSTLAAQQPEVNIVRTAYQALAAVLGGTQSLHANAYDEALGLPTEAAARLALRTQQVLAHETGVAEVIDPLAGSYCVESLTNQLEAEARAILEEIENRGGMLAVIASGWARRAIEDHAYAEQREIESGRRVVVGVNRFREAGAAEPAPVFVVNPAVESAQIERLREWRAARDAGRLGGALAAVEAAAADAGAALMPAVLDAVEAGATVGEISDRLRARWGEFQPA